MVSGAYATLGRVDAGGWISIIAVIVAAAAAYFARQQARFARDQADAATRQTELQQQLQRDAAQPYVWADFRLDERNGVILVVVVQNDGPTVATDVRVVFDPPLEGTEPNRTLPDPARVIPSMPPGRRLVWHLDAAPDRFASALPLRYVVTITGRGPFGGMDALRYVLDLEDFRRASSIANGSLAGIEDSVKKVAEALRERPKTPPLPQFRPPFST